MGVASSAEVWRMSLIFVYRHCLSSCSARHSFSNLSILRQNNSNSFSFSALWQERDEGLQWRKTERERERDEWPGSKFVTYLNVYLCSRPYLFDHLDKGLVAALKPRLPDIWLFVKLLHLLSHLDDMHLLMGWVGWKNDNQTYKLNFFRVWKLLTKHLWPANI